DWMRTTMNQPHYDLHTTMGKMLGYTDSWRVMHENEGFYFLLDDLSEHPDLLESALEFARLGHARLSPSAEKPRHLVFEPNEPDGRHSIIYEEHVDIVHQLANSKMYRPRGLLHIMALEDHVTSHW